MSSQLPRKAFVLAAGFGTRMLPLTRDIPKPLLPVWGKPVLQHVLVMLRRWGVREVIINLHHGADKVFEFVTRHEGFGLPVTFSFEPDILGTGGALRRAEWFFDDDPFWLVNADVVADLDPRPLLRAFQRKRALAALWMHPEKGPRTVDVENGRVRTFTSRHPGAENTMTFCGIHLLRPDILDYLPGDGFAGIVPAYRQAMRKGRHVAGVSVQRCFWADIGTPRQYLDAHRDILAAYRRSRRGGKLFDPDRFREVPEGFLAVDPTARVAARAKVFDVVILPHARVQSTANIAGGIVGPDAVARTRVNRMALRADRIVDPTEREALGDAGIDVPKATALPLAPRGSARTFTRVEDGTHSVLLVRFSKEREENTLYARHTLFLESLGMRVPRLLVDDGARGVLVVEDLGTRTVLDRIRRRPEPSAVRALYRRIFKQVLLLHEKGAAAAARRQLPLMSPFSARLYRWEREYFDKHFAREYAGLRRLTRAKLQEELLRCARTLVREPKVLIHRDLQSSNILLTSRGPAFIDFQGMRIGAAAYDIASLLCDPYVSFSEEMQETLLEDYRKIAGRDAVSEQVFWLAAVQRLAQALGAYARLGNLRETESFRDHLLPGLKMLARAARKTGRFPTLTRTAESVAHDFDGH